MKHHIIIIPGLSDNPLLSSFALKPLKKAGFEPEIFIYRWSVKRVVGVGGAPIENQLNRRWRETTDRTRDRLNQLIQKKSKTGKVSLIGLSAGGSASINAFFKTQKVHKVITICSRINTGGRHFPDFNYLARHKPAYKISVKLAQANLENLTPIHSQRILAVHPLWDETVTVESQIIHKANNLTLASVLHVPTIFLTLTYHLPKLVEFLKK